MNNTLTKYTNFEAMKMDIRPSTLPEAEKEWLNTEARQMAEVLQTLRKKKYGTARK